MLAGLLWRRLRRRDLIGLLDEYDTPVLGLVAAPALQRRWWAAVGSGAWTGRSLTSARRLTVSRVQHISDASISYSSLSGWRALGRRQRFLDLLDACWRTRAYGDFWSYMMVAEGAVDIACEPELALYDMAALVPIVTEAGGRFTSLDGTDGPHGAFLRRRGITCACAPESSSRFEYHAAAAISTILSLFGRSRPYRLSRLPF